MACRLLLALAALGALPGSPALAQAPEQEQAQAPEQAQAQEAPPAGRTIVADVVAINQPLVYNRFNSVNPWGMIYSLRRDVEGCAPEAFDAQKCRPGAALLKSGKRPRPLVIRVAKGDRLVIRFQNLLRPEGEGERGLDGAAVGFEPAQFEKLPDGAFRFHEQPHCDRDTPHAQRQPCDASRFQSVPNPPDDPRTRRSGIAVVGLTNLHPDDPVLSGLVGVEPGQSVEYEFQATEEGPYFFSSIAAMAGGEGDGGSLTHGLFGMVVVEPEGSRFYRSQVSEEVLACARGMLAGCQSNASPQSWVNYEAVDDAGIPLLNMLAPPGTDGTVELVHGDLTAIIWNAEVAHRIGQPASEEVRVGEDAWREFAIIFHDELKTVHDDDFPVLNDPGENASEVEKVRHKQMAGTRDGFAINYGASGMGPIVLANRAGKGPARDCVECAYEEFFLQSWANGDPALLAQYADDPSNVYHSYLGDRVKFHNAHAGPKETHVFHLHAHQWLSQARNDQANYLDSQTIAPFQTYSYEIYYGGTGNRNYTPGDSIFHCHLYPHFAQGMWSLWRVHEVMEDGSRRLPDGGGMDGDFAGPGTDPLTGLVQGGTPIPGLVPLPGQALPPEPSYPDAADPAHLAASAEEAMPGYPFYIPGRPGFRAPQPPLDMARADDGTYLDGGLPRHLTLEGTREVTVTHPDGTTAAFPVSDVVRAIDEGVMTYDITAARLLLLPQEGTALERAAMRFHEAGLEDMVQTRVSTDLAAPLRPFLVNGQERAPGAPFANPCPVDADRARHWAPGLRSQMTGTRTYDVSAIEMQLLVNQYGWHDPQARINVLTRDVDQFLPIEARTPQAAKPFFFRASSGECVVFHHQNRTRSKTDLDAFQVETPVDIIGQHIHLVKFDVTSSDGSANGFNYEDGTYAPDHIEHLIEATHAPGGSVEWHPDLTAAEQLTSLEVQTGEAAFQTTTQRWWADPLLDYEGRDRTIATVFTHDHFGPSTIQQHGFYSALLVEPRGSQWFEPDGTPLSDGVGTQAIIHMPEPEECIERAEVAKNLCVTRREFAMAVADFALLYDDAGSDPGRHDPLDRPIAPPIRCFRTADNACADADGGEAGEIVYRAEAISVDHHDPYLFNYRNEPIPYRIGREHSGRWQQHGDYTLATGRGNMANVFDTTVHAPDADLSRLAQIDTEGNHAPGDPSTEIFEGYVGEPIQVRLVQGAQEVQHVFMVTGRNWLRQPAAIEDDLTGLPPHVQRDNIRVSAQEIGISEHFEFDFDLPVGATFSRESTFDYLYASGTVDALWNGAWGLFRSYPDTQGRATGGAEAPIRCRLLPLGSLGAVRVADPGCPEGTAAVSADDAGDRTLANPALSAPQVGGLFLPQEGVQDPHLLHRGAERADRLQCARQPRRPRCRAPAHGPPVRERRAARP